ncbi:DUF4238 domain-containing protein [Alcanivorax sp. VBW004]|uniref:DUF4238 domain-containing protein n=1 Tax=Alcanivorax sp. VBW004 TaxID=1287708 RepID=UPI0012BB7772|nr:DUF4238 domain-containing protein [Alcanivorax sp. VBW004]MTT52990.1 DUF4238 domain-containing protein [Alcanivorax sp. VBW004]
MPTNKNQHFVPRCYLRPFTNDEEGKAIKIFNIDREIFIDKAAVKKQCSGDYFYGDDEDLEKSIQSLEQAYAGVLRRVRLDCYNKLEEGDELLLKRFWLFQYMRTEAASRRMVEMNSKLGEMVGEDQSYRMEIKEAVIESMRTYAEVMKITDDLRGCLVKLNSEMKVVASDDPAILTNRWFKADPKLKEAGYGLGSAGIIAILPLSAQMVFIAYDPDVYSVSKKNGIFKSKKSDDIRALNQFQFLNCRANIFPGEHQCDQALIEVYNSCRQNRIEERHVLQYAVLDGIEDEHKRFRVVASADEEEHQEAIVHSQALFPEPTMWPSFLRWRKKGFGMVNGTGVGCVRRSQSEVRGGPKYRKLYTKR